MAAQKTVTVVVVGDVRSAQAALRSLQRTTQDLESRMGRFGAGLQRFGSGLARVGSTLTRRVSLPLVAIGGVATKLALDYDAAFTRIAAVSNAASEDIARWRVEVLRLAGETARAPEELANALFFLASAGLDAEQVMPTLAASAKAAAAGLGETQDIARLVANALNAYAGSGLQASQVTDILVAAVREGSAETTEFADAMGRILPIASKAGVGFEELAASLAVLSNIGLDVNEGVTAMRGLLQALVAPGTQAAETMHQVGISADEMRRVISEQGVLGALRLLEERTAGNIDLMRRIVPNVRALTGALGITSQEAEKVDAIFGRVLASTGALDEAFGEASKSAGFRLQQSLAQLKVAGVELGQRLLPIVTDVVRSLANLADRFAALPRPVQATIVQLGLLVVALGPVLSTVGRLTGFFGALIARAPAVVASLRSIATAAMALSARVPALLAVMALVGAGTAVHGAVQNEREWDEMVARLEATARSWQNMAARYAAASRALHETTGSMSLRVADALGVVRREVVRTSTVAAERFRAWLQSWRGSLGGAQEALAELAGDMRVSTREVLRAFGRQAEALADYRANWQAVAQRGLPLELAQQLAEMGLQGAGVLQALADASQRQWDRIVAEWRRGQREARRTEAALGRLGEAVRAVPNTVPIRVTVTGAAAAAHALRVTGEVPGLQHGGVVTRPTLALVGERGPEAVVPLREMGRVSVQRVGDVHVSVTVDRRRVAESLAQRLLYAGVW